MHFQKVEAAAGLVLSFGMGGIGGRGAKGRRGVVMYHLAMPPSSYLSLNTSVPTSTLSFWCSQVSNLRRMKRCWEEECLGQWCFSLSPPHCSPHCDANRPPSKSCSPSSLPARSHRPRQWCRALCLKGLVGVAKNHFLVHFRFDELCCEADDMLISGWYHWFGFLLFHFWSNPESRTLNIRFHLPLRLVRIAPQYVFCVW